MPYEIKEKKGHKFSVVNKETGKVMSKGTTKTKAKKQIQAIYANMPPEHRLRHRIGLLNGVVMHNPVHRAVIRLAKGLLKKEEIYGGSWWDDAGDWFTQAAKDTWKVINFLDPEEYPMLNAVLGYTAAHPMEVLEEVGEAVEEKLPEILETAAVVAEMAVPELSPFINGGIGAYEAYKNYKNKGEEDTGEAEEEEYMKSTKKKSPSMAEKLDTLVKHISTSYHHEINDALRFPMVYNYDENNTPQRLQDFLLSSGVAGVNFSKNEFGNTWKNQQPYAFLDFPINGGKIRTIDYSKLGYSKY